MAQSRRFGWWVAIVVATALFFKFSHFVFTFPLIFGLCCWGIVFGVCLWLDARRCSSATPSAGDHSSTVPTRLFLHQHSKPRDLVI
jgi:hypothetical protein